MLFRVNLNNNKLNVCFMRLEGKFQFKSTNIRNVPNVDKLNLTNFHEILHQLSSNQRIIFVNYLLSFNVFVHKLIQMHPNMWSHMDSEGKFQLKLDNIRSVPNMQPQLDLINRSCSSKSRIWEIFWEILHQFSSNQGLWPLYTSHTWSQQNP